VEIPFGHIENNVLYRSAFREYDALKLREVKDEEGTDVLVSSYISNYDKLFNKFSATEEKINTSNNKGSFLSDSNSFSFL